MSTKDPSEQDAKLILDIYDHALTHDLDITSKHDVKKILEALGQKSVTVNRLKRLMLALAVTDRRVRKDVGGRKKEIN